MALDEKDLKVFIKGVENYFQTMFSEKAIVDPPFMHGDEQVIQDFTGVIGISGRQRGAIYFTASKGMVREMLTALGESAEDEEGAADMVGEVANTLSGNARREFGGEFLISVPVVLQGRVESVNFPKRTTSFIIPFVWRHHRAHLIVCLRDPEAGDD